MLKILVIGDSGVGKTSLLKQYVDKSVASHKPTIGSDFLKKEIMVENSQVTLTIWDTAGQEQYQSLGSSYYRGSDCCALVFDLTEPKSFESLTAWKQRFLEGAAPTN